MLRVIGRLAADFEHLHQTVHMASGSLQRPEQIRGWRDDESSCS